VERSIQRSERAMDRYYDEGMSSNQRLASYHDSWQMHQARPLWGWGFGSFIHIHPIYASEVFYGKDPDYPVAYEFTHSDPLQSLVEFGIAGCALLFGPFLVLIVGLRRALARNRLTAWPLGACAGVCLASTVDMAFTAPAIAAGVLLCASAAVRYGIETRRLKGDVG
jgi:O-antigen ligase